MTQAELQTYHEHSFDAFCKKVIKHAAADAHREKRKHLKASLDIDNPIVSYIHSIQTNDAYTFYTRTFYVKNLTIQVRDRRLGEALQYIIPNKRSVLLLSYFGGYTDTEVANILGISPTSVARRKQAGLIRLRELMEAWFYE